MLLVISLRYEQPSDTYVLQQQQNRYTVIAALELSQVPHITVLSGKALQVKGAACEVTWSNVQTSAEESPAEAVLQVQGCFLITSCCPIDPSQDLKMSEHFPGVYDECEESMETHKVQR